jgi:hypothetical protein
MPAFSFGDGNGQPPQETIGRARHGARFVFFDGWGDLDGLGPIWRVHDDGRSAVRSMVERGEHAEAASLPGRQCRRCTRATCVAKIATRTAGGRKRSFISGRPRGIRCQSARSIGPHWLCATPLTFTDVHPAGASE